MEVKNFKCHIVTDINKYLSVIKEIYEHENAEIGELWFRGQPSTGLRLLPSALRDVVPIIDARGNKIEGGRWRSGGETVAGLRVDKMLDDFKRRAPALLSYTPKNDFEWMFIAQHYGIPTRLLDWTTNPLIALYFALPKHIDNEMSGDEAIESFLSSGGFGSGGSAVFVIDPCAINNETCDVPYLLNVVDNYEEWKHYVNPMRPSRASAFLPICIANNQIDSRIRVQSGNFTLHGSNIWPLDYYTVLQPLIHKIFIPYTCVEELRKDLKLLGITDSVVFPDLQSLAKEIYEDERKSFWTAYKEDLIFTEED